jgi:hypothetical protein
MAFSQADLDKLDQALADGRGARQITFEDQSITFHSIDEMLKLRAVMVREVSSTVKNHRLAVVKKGT